MCFLPEFTIYIDLLQLMMLHNRRAKRSKDTKTIPPMVDGKITFLTTLSTCDPKVLRTKSCLEASDKYDIENFLNPGTRDITFQLLFEEVWYFSLTMYHWLFIFV